MNRYVETLTKVTIHPLFWVVIAIGIVTAHFKELFVLFMIIFIHELGHALAAAHFRWRIKSIQLLPFGGVAELEEHGNKPLKEECIVVLAGPLQHIWMGLLAYVLHAGGLLSETAYTFFMWNNLTIFFFNLLPIWPLDGGKLLLNAYAVFVPFLQAQRLMLLTSTVSFIFLAGFMLIWNTSNVTMWTVLIFLAVSMYIEWKQRQYTFLRFLLERYYGKRRDIEKLKLINADANDPLYTVFTKFRRGYKHSVVIQANGREQYTLDENELLYAYFTEKRIRSSIGELIS